MKFLTTGEVADRLYCTSQAVKLMCEAGRFPNAFRPFSGAWWRIPENDVAQLIESGRPRVIRRQAVG